MFCHLKNLRSTGRSKIANLKAFIRLYFYIYIANTERVRLHPLSASHTLVILAPSQPSSLSDVLCRLPYTLYSLHYVTCRVLQVGTPPGPNTLPIRSCRNVYPKVTDQPENPLLRVPPSAQVCARGCWGGLRALVVLPPIGSGLRVFMRPLCDLLVTLTMGLRTKVGMCADMSRWVGSALAVQCSD